MGRSRQAINGWAALLISLAISSSPQFSAAAESTHQQSAIIKIKEVKNSLSINAFCLNEQEQIVAACGDGPGEIRIIDDTGKILHSWKVAVKPEAVNVGPKQTILVGGEGKLFKFSATGELLLEQDSPHSQALRENTEALREQAITRLQQVGGNSEAQIASYERLLETLDKRKEQGALSKNEEQVYDMIQERLATAKAALEAKDGKVNPKAIEQQVQALIASKLRISSLSSNGTEIFVATPSIEGYGYSVWRMNENFEEASVIITGLAGCCGQMDVQSCEEGLFVAENSRHRVVRYDSDGEVQTTWGSRDRSGEEGFVGCCNPMNVCFGSKGSVFTAESGEGRIRQYDVNGELVATIGSVELVPGCKNVSIAATEDHSKIYMLDLTRNHIVLMTPSSTAGEGKVQAAALEATSPRGE